MKTNTDDDSIKVCIRMRPLLKPYEDEEAWTINEQTHTIYSMQGQKQDSLNSFSAFIPSNSSYINESVLLQGKRDTRRKYYDNLSQYSFQFDHVAGPELKTQQIYNQIGKSITRSVLDGYNGTIFMYGQTTSGKTYTMLGTPDAPGILPCAVRDVFMEINKRKDMLFKVWISYIEIYNEVINDLLAPGVTNLKISEDPKFGVVVNGAKQQQVWSFDQAIILMNYGEESRVYRETNVHEHSSRSHTLFRVFIESQTNNIESENILHRYSCLNLVDLAGSERLADYEGKTESVGETGYINKSLFVLANVINKLAEGKKGHIPYRDSKLTRILSQALGGNSLTAIICTISPANVNFYQTLSTLRFATRAKTVKNTPEVNELTYGLEIKEQSVLQEKINKLQNELMTTREEIDRMANSKLEIQISLENANEKIAQLEKENAQLRRKLEQTAIEKSIFDDPYNKSTTMGSMSNTEIEEKYNILLQSYNEEKTKRLRLEGKLKDQNDESEEINLREITFMENLLWNINSIFMDSENKKQVNEENLENWFNYTENLAAQYKIEVIGLQNKFRDSLRELVQKFVPESLDEIYNYLTTINSHANTTTSEEAKNHETMQKILNRKVFETVLFNPTKVLNSNELSPSEKLHLIKEDYEKGVKKVNMIYDESRNTLEEYFRKKVNAMKIKEPQGKGPKVSKETSPQETNIVNITNEHQEKLNILRKLYENELKSLEKVLDEKYLEASLSLSGTEPEKFLNPILKKTDLLVEREQNISETGIQKRDSKKILQQAKPEKPVKVDLKGEEYSGFIYLWGSGKDGRLGNGSEKSEKVPKKIDFTKYRQISCGYHHTAAIDLNGQVFTWGKGVSGQLGTRAFSNEAFPVHVPIANNLNIVQVSCGWQHTIAVSQDGQIFSWGKGSDGQLGHGDNTDYPEPTKIRFFDKIPGVRIAAGHSHSAAISASGDLYMWGCNIDHRLMIQNHENQYLPALTELNTIKTDESLEVVDIALGVGHSAAITRNGSVFTGGVGTEGQLGTFIDEETENSIIIARKRSEDFNQDDDYQDESMNDVEMYERYCFLHRIKTFGPQNKATKVSCGDNYTLVLTEKGILYSFGKGSHFRLGHSDIQPNENVYQPKPIDFLRDQKLVQISAGCRHAACVTQKGEVYGWGFNFYDQLGLGESDHDIEKPTKLNKLAGKNVKGISCGYFHTGAVIEN